MKMRTPGSACAYLQRLCVGGSETPMCICTTWNIQLSRGTAFPTRLHVRPGSGGGEGGGGGQGAGMPLEL